VSTKKNVIHSKKVSEGKELFFILGTLRNVANLEGNVENSSGIFILLALYQIEKIKAANAEQMGAVRKSIDPSQEEKEEEELIDGEDMQKL
jgi:hypothetical protein